LSLPSIDCKIKQDGDNMFIFDIVRKKYVFLTPEEWVRQHFLHYLITDLNYPKSLIKIESGLKYNNRTKRSDIVAYSREAKPLMLIECKSSDYHLNERVIQQASMYNKVLQARYVVITNGKEHSCFTYNQLKKEVEFLSEIPSFVEN